MKLIAELADRLGISLRSLAIVLGTDHTHLSRYESHTRSLPLASTAQVAQLVAMTHKAPPPQPPQPTAEEKAEAQKRADWCRVLVQPLQTKLAAMQKSYQQAQLMLSVLDQYTKATSELTPKIKSWVAGQRFAANKKIDENGWQPQQIVLQKINALEAEALFWEAAIAADKD